MIKKIGCTKISKQNLLRTVKEDIYILYILPICRKNLNMDIFIFFIILMIL